MKKLRLAIAFLGILVVVSGLAVITAPTARAAPTRSFILYGDAVKGWGSSNATLRSPGPTLTVNEGDAVSVELLSNDRAQHTWFIDYNNNSAADPGEPTSGTFSSSTVPLWYNFTADAGHVGTWTYRCAIHPSVMTGLFVILAPPTFALYGSAAAGWGLTATDIHNPGPSLTVTPGQTVTFELVSQDGQAHTFFVDLNNNGVADPNEPQSPTFGGPSHPSVTTWSWTVTATSGTYAYYCGIHLTAMKGTIVVASSTPPPSPPDYAIYAAIIVVVAVVAIVAVVLIRRRPRSPPAEPPQEFAKPR